MSQILWPHLHEYCNMSPDFVLLNTIPTTSVRSNLFLLSHTQRSMDIFFSVLALFFFSSFLFSISKRLLAKPKKLPPTPPSLPILGHLHLMKKPLHRSLTVLSNRYGPILSLRFGSRPVLLISSPSSAEDCLSKNDIIFANRPRLLFGKCMAYNYSAIGWAPYGPHWRNLRRIATVEILSTNRIQMFSAVRIQEVRSLVKDLFNDSELGKSVVELKSRFSELTFNIMMGIIAGKRYYGENVVDLEEARRFRKIVKEVLLLAGASNFGDFLPFLGWMDLGGVEKRMVRLARERDEFLLALIDEHRRRKNKDDFSGEQGEGKKMKKTLIDVLLSLQETEPQYYTDHIIMGLIGVIITSLFTDPLLRHLRSDPDRSFVDPAEGSQAFEISLSSLKWLMPYIIVVGTGAN